MSKEKILSITIYLNDKERELMAESYCCDECFNDEFLSLYESMGELINTGIPPIDFIRGNLTTN